MYIKLYKHRVYLKKMSFARWKLPTNRGVFPADSTKKKTGEIMGRSLATCNNQRGNDTEMDVFKIVY